MAAHGVLILNNVAATNVDSYNRSVVTGSDIDVDNGHIFPLLSQSSLSGYSEVWSFGVTTGSQHDLWMAYEPEIVLTSAKYRGIDPDPRNFYNPSGATYSGSFVFSAFMPRIGDVITVTAAALSGSPSSGDYVNCAANSCILTWGGGMGSFLSFKLLKETYISIGTGGLGDTNRILAYKLACVSV
jgi:hypothetical protein